MGVWEVGRDGGRVPAIKWLMGEDEGSGEEMGIAGAVRPNVGRKGQGWEDWGSWEGR